MKIWNVEVTHGNEGGAWDSARVIAKDYAEAVEKALKVISEDNDSKIFAKLRVTKIEEETGDLDSL